MAETTENRRDDGDATLGDVARLIAGIALIAWTSLFLVAETAAMIGAAVTYRIGAADLVYGWRAVGWFLNVGMLVVGVWMLTARKPSMN